jgi:hypothetical protein
MRSAILSFLRGFLPTLVLLAHEGVDNITPLPEKQCVRELYVRIP